MVQNKAVQFDDQPLIVPSSSGSDSNRHRDRANSVSGDNHRHSSSTSSSRRHKSSRKERSQSLSRTTGTAGSDSDNTIILPDRFDKYGRPKDNNNNVENRIGDRIESILNGRAAGNFFKRIFND